MIRLLKPIIILLIFGMLAYRTNIKYNRIDKALNNFSSTRIVNINTSSWEIASGFLISWNIVSGASQTWFQMINTWILYSGVWPVELDISNSVSGKITSGYAEILLDDGLSWDKVLLSNCVFRDKIIQNWSYIIAYRQKYTNICEYQKRYCADWKLDGDYIYDTCIYGSMNDPSISSNDANDESNLADSSKSENIANIKTKNVWWSTKMKDDYDDVSKYIDEFINTYPDNSTNNWSSNWGAELYNKTNIKSALDNRKKNVDTVMNDDHTSKPKSLEEYVKMMSQIGDHLNSKWNNTTTQQKINSNSADLKLIKWCITPWWAKISNWQSIIAYSAPATTFPKACEFETRYCNNWVLDWNYSYQNCEFWQLTYQTNFDASSYYIYSDNSSIYYPNYISKNIGLWFYLSNSNNITIQNDTKKWCWADNVYIPNWETKTFYKNNTVSRWTYCASINRTCSDWVLWWDVSYGSVYCRQSDPISCRAPVYNIYIPHGSSKPYYKKTGNSCSVDYRYCNNWILWGSLTWIVNCLTK